MPDTPEKASPDPPKPLPTDPNTVEIVDITDQHLGEGRIYTGMVMPKRNPASGEGAAPRDIEPEQNS